LRAVSGCRPRSATSGGTAIRAPAPARSAWGPGRCRRGRGTPAAGGCELFIYTRTPQQNARTIWGHYFPGFTEHEQRLHSEAALREAIRATSGLNVTGTQTFKLPRSSTAERLRAQAEGRHYSTFSLYPPQELRASIATFLARLPNPEVYWVDEHLLVVTSGEPPQPERA
jgi:hypothetical protein